jgi:RNA polymerase sigma factor (sigma-70 family)
VPAATLSTRAPARPFRSKRLLAVLGDDRLVEQIRRGNELAFEVAFERHGAGILAFCRHMLGSREEAEDAVQHTFAAAFRDLQRDGERSIALRAWLYTIARNRCLSLLRARREQAAELEELPTEGLGEQVERRAELRELLADVRELPEDQRAALLLAEAGGLSHAEVAAVLGCEVGAVKGLVFRARSGLIERRAARDTPCTEIREQLETLRGGALRRNELRHHLRQCPGCAQYREDVRRQRQMLAAALPVVPTMGLKANVLAAAGLGGGAAGGGAAAGGIAGGAALGSLGSATLAKVAVVGALATGGVVAGEAVVDQAGENPATVAPAAEPKGPAERALEVRPETAGEHGRLISGERNKGQRGLEMRSERSRGRGPKNAAARGKERAAGKDSDGGRGLGHERRLERGAGGTGRTREPGGSANANPNVEPKSPVQVRPLPEPKQAPAPKVQVEEPAPVVEVAPAPAPGQGKIKAIR